MALSEETKAIIDQLKKEGELVRAQDRDSMAQVNVTLSKFDEAFVSISSMVESNRDMLKLSQDNIKKQAKAAKTQDDFKDLEREKDTKADDKTANRMGNSVKNAIENASVRGALGGVANLMKMGGAAFLGFNILKGFIDEKYDGMFTQMQTDIGEALQGFDPQALTTQISELTATIERIKQEINDVTDSLLFKIAAFALSIPFGMAISSGIARGIIGRRGPRGGDAGLDEAKRIKAIQDAGGRNTGPRGGDAGLDEARALRDAQNKPPVIDTDVPNSLNNPEIDGNSGRPIAGSGDPNIDMNRPAGPTAPDGPGKLPVVVDPPAPRPRPYRGFGRTPMGQVGSAGTNSFLSNQARDLRVSQYKGANQHATNADIEEAIKNVKHAKIFKGLLKGLAVLGIAMTVYDMHRLYQVYKTGGDVKAELVVLFGELVGGIAGFTAGAAIGAFGGPWGLFIGGLIGGVGGSLFGGALLGAIWDWANEVPLTREEAMEKLEGEIESQRIAVTEAVAYANDNPQNYQAGYSVDGARAGLAALEQKRDDYIASYDAAVVAAGGRPMGTSAGRRDNRKSLIPMNQKSLADSMAEIESYLSGVGGGVVIDRSTHINSTPVSQHGGNHNSAVTVIGGGNPGESNRTLPGFVN